MNQTSVRSRLLNALASGAAAYLALLLMASWITGLAEFLPLIIPMTPLFLAISFGASIIEASLTPKHIKRSVIVGIASGLTGGVAIIFHAFSKI